MKISLFFFVFLITTVSVSSQSYNFLGSYTADGTPLYFVPSDIITVETTNLVKRSLPERYPVPVYNPQYISSGYDTDIVIEKLADIWVTFISEGTGYKNVLGFYTYDINSPPTTAPTASQITIVFPNSSAVNSGGGLVAGNKVKIGTFQPGTGIGWVLKTNGWDGTQIANGLWTVYSNPSFNPEVDPQLKHHTVLLNDPQNNRVLLGFEDIRRDDRRCDNDFNDVVFYVSANPHEAIRSNNLADVSSAAVVTSGNTGGLESTGDLAALIAKRNFKRIKTNSFADAKNKQKSFSSDVAKTASALSAVLPITGMYGTETALVSSPSDLIGITNALEVYSVDYYEGEKRLAAVLATSTTGGIYQHSKAICDRLNNSSLEDIRVINLNGFDIIMSKIKRDDGSLEYALNFSVQKLAGENKLHSYWNIGQYPVGDYDNFQVWGASMGQVSSITNHILDQYQTQGALVDNKINNRIPTVFVKKGYYKNGQLNLKIINKTKASSILFTGNQKSTELDVTTTSLQNITLSSAYEEDIVVPTGGLFDIGFSIQENNTPIIDALYLADGPWGLDFLKTETTITKHEITNPVVAITADDYAIERNVKVEGTVYGTVNLFRNILAGELAFDAKNYLNVAFRVKNSLGVEVVLVTENMGDWNNRLRFQIPANITVSSLSIALADFKNTAGLAYNNQKIKGFVFSTVGNYTSFQNFAIEISDLKLSNKSALSIIDDKISILTETYNYPNPCNTNMIIVLPKITTSATVSIIDLKGNLIRSKNYNLSSDEININVEGLAKGLYIYEVVTKENEKWQSKFMVQ